MANDSKINSMSYYPATRASANGWMMTNPKREYSMISGVIAMRDNHSMTNNLDDFLYHLTSIDDCGEILRRGSISPLHKSDVVRTSCGKDIFHATSCVHFNFCPRSLMLFELTQGHCWSAHKIWGQGDAVHIEIDYTQMMVHLGLNGVASFVVSDSDFSHGGQNPNIKVFNVNSTLMACVENMLDVFAIERRISSFDADKYQGKGAEIMVGADVDLCPDMVMTIGVNDEKAKGRLLGKSWISDAYKNKIFIRDDWYY